jgi:hypothetical protein
MTFWACSRLFQKVSPDIRAVNSVIRFCAPGTSKKPPQVREFLGRRRNFRPDVVEHSRGKLHETLAGIQWESDLEPITKWGMGALFSGGRLARRGEGA